MDCVGCIVPYKGEERQNGRVSISAIRAETGVTHLSLNALRIRSTSSSRWKAFASRLSSFSISPSSGVLVPGVVVLVAGVVDAEGLSDMAITTQRDLGYDTVSYNERPRHALMRIRRRRTMCAVYTSCGTMSVCYKRGGGTLEA